MIFKIIQVDRQCFLLIKIALKFILLALCCWWCFTLIHTNRLQSLDVRCRSSSAVFSQAGARQCWLLNESLRCFLGLFLLRNFSSVRKLESTVPTCLISACVFVPESPLQEQIILGVLHMICCGISSLDVWRSGKHTE